MKNKLLFAFFLVLGMIIIWGPFVAAIIWAYYQFGSMVILIVSGVVLWVLVMNVFAFGAQYYLDKILRDER